MISETDPDGFSAMTTLDKAVCDAMRIVWESHCFQVAVERSRDLPFHENML